MQVSAFDRKMLQGTFGIVASFQLILLLSSDQSRCSKLSRATLQRADLKCCCACTVT